MKSIQKYFITMAILTGLGLFTFLAEPAVALAQDYPVKPINIYVGFSPGGAGSNSIHIFAEGAKKYLSKPQPILIINKPGASTAIAADFVLKQPADGYSLFLFPTDICGKLAKDGHQLSFKMEDFIPIGTYGMSPQMLVVGKEKSPFKTLDDFLDYAKKHPEQLSYGSTGVGSIDHLTAEIFMLQCGIKLNQIPLGGGAPKVPALLGGHVDCAFTTPGSVLDHIKPGGGLRVLVVLTPQRWPDLPDVPTCLEKGYNVDRSFWCALAASKGTPQPVLDILQKVFEKTTNDPQVKANLLRIGFIPLNWSPEETKKIAKKEFDLAKDFYKKIGL
jgi:tripartite-type tricarboxylate transporter receptor subunit TctC